MQIINVQTLIVAKGQMLVNFDDYPNKITLYTRERLLQSEIVPAVTRAIQMENEARVATNRPSLLQEHTQRIDDNLKEFFRLFPGFVRA